MKVRELIQALSEQPGGSEVLVDYRYKDMVFILHGQKPIKDVKFDDQDGVLLCLDYTCAR